MAYYKVRLSNSCISSEKSTRI